MLNIYERANLINMTFDEMIAQWVKNGCYNPKMVSSGQRTDLENLRLIELFLNDIENLKTDLFIAKAQYVRNTDLGFSLNRIKREYKATRYAEKWFPFDFLLKDFIYIYIIVFVYILFSYAINNFEDMTLLKKWIIFFLKGFVGIYLLLLILKAYKYTFMEMICFLQVIIFIHAIFMLIYFFNADFKEWTLHFIPQSGGNIDHVTSYRSRGIVGSSGATLSLFQSFGLLFTIYLVSEKKLNRYLLNYFLISFIIILGSIVVSGRTGLLILPMILLYTFLLYFKDLESSKKSIKFLVLVLVLVLGWQLVRPVGWHC